MSVDTTATIARYANRGLWALPIFAATLFAGTITHQPAPQTALADWSNYVTTSEFLLSHLVLSIGGAIFGAIAAVSLGLVLIGRGSVRLGLWGALTGVAANVLGSSIFGIAAFAQPALGRFYRAGRHDLDQDVEYGAAARTPSPVISVPGPTL